MMQLRSFWEEKTSQMQLLRAYFKEHRISLPHSERVQKYVKHHAVAQWKEENKVRLARVLPKKLLYELCKESRAPVLCWHPFLRGLRAESAHVVRQLCEEALSMLAASAGLQPRRCVRTHDLR